MLVRENYEPTGSLRLVFFSLAAITFRRSWFPGFGSTINDGSTFFLYCWRWRRPRKWHSRESGFENSQSHNLQRYLTVLLLLLIIWLERNFFEKERKTVSELWLKGYISRPIRFQQTLDNFIVCRNLSFVC